MAVDVIVPKFGLTVTEVEVVEWLSAADSVVVEGEPLVVVTADKADVEITAPASGVLAEVVAAVGDPVDVGGLLARIHVPGEHPVAGAPEPAAPTTAAVPPPSDAAGDPEPYGPAQVRVAGDRVPASPLARREARELGVDIAAISGTGPGGRVVRADVRRAAESGRSAPAPTAVAASAAGPGADADEHTVVPMSPVRRVTARRMAASARTTAPAVITVACDASQAVLVQQRARAAGVPATVTHLVMLATARALAAHPALNGYFVDDQVVAVSSVNLGLAVDVDGDLYVPVVRDCAALDLPGLVSATRSAVDRARTGALSADDAGGGTFTVSNLGMLGVESFTPIINAPQIGILGVGATRDEVVVVDGVPRVRPVLRLSLTFDHRAVDGAPAARFLADVRRRLEDADEVALPAG